MQSPNASDGTRNDRPGPPAETPAVAPGSAFPVVGVGASAGGLEAITGLLRHLSPNPGLALVVVQHLDPRHESLLTTILSQATSMPVTEARQGEPVEVNHVYVIPPNAELSVVGGALSLLPREGRPVPHMPIDALLRSLADDLGSRAVGIILSGGGSDGTLGLEAIKAAGGVTFAQDESSAVQSSMPRYAAASGCVDFVLPVEGIARELIRLGTHPYLTLPASPVAPDGPAPLNVAGTSKDGDSLAAIFALIKARMGVDFTLYKRATIQRRLERRMAVLGASDTADMLRLLETSRAEVDALFQEFLLRVTGFFRDPEAFEALRTTVFPALMKEHPPDQPIRAWVAGCSTGEEAYSLAIALTEFLDEASPHTPIKILATDVNDAVLEVARAGTYLDNIAQDVSPERLRRFFQKADGRYRIAKSVRDVCVFARHNLLSDPPFSRMDLITCRNVLIYFDSSLQRRTVPLFHYALQPGGYLMLGPSEAVGNFPDLFGTTDRERSIYVRTLARARMPLEIAGREQRASRAQAGPDVTGPPHDALEAEGLLQREADQILARYAPSGVLIDENFNVLRFRGDTSPYLRNPPGKPGLDVRWMARDGLLPALRQAIGSAQAGNAPAREAGAVLDAGGPPRPVVVQAIPVNAEGPGPRCLLVLFEEPHQARPSPFRPQEQEPASPQEADERMAVLQRELDAAREHLQSVIEDYEATNEELRSASEEVLASNEELQSTNEELQTAKEEMQSTNEELDTTNEELQHRNRELGLVNDDLTNLLAAAYIPIVMVNRDLRIRRFTAQAEKPFNLTSGDVGRPIREARFDIDCPNLEQLITRAIDALETSTVEAQDRSGRWYSVRARPYVAIDNRIDGAVITAIDIDAIRRSEQQVREARDFTNSILDTVQESLLVIDAAGRVRTANRSFFLAFRLLPGEVEQRPFFEIGAGALDIAPVRELLTGAGTNGGPARDIEFEHHFPEIGHRALRATVRSLPTQEPGGLLLLAIEDITERRNSERARRELEAKMFQAQKMESLGVLAGGVAHDLNNLLTPVMGYTELAQGLLPTGSEARTLLDESMKATERAAELIQQMLAYSGKGRFVVQPVDLSALVRDMDGLVRAAVSKSIGLSYELAGSLPPVEADATQLRQVLMNFVTNGSEAIGAGKGTVTVRTRFVPVGEEAVRLPYAGERLPPGPYAVLEVEDNGCGMTPGTMERMFDPFFTTKFTGRGLGLAAVLGIAQGHRGAIQARSNVGIGSTFQFLLPCSSRPLVAPSTRPEPGAARGAGAVLLVDDEEAVREIASLILERAGFTVLRAHDGREGVEAARGHDEIIAVLLDVTMPGMNGRECAEAIGALRPSLPVLLMSGYSVEEMRARYEGSGAAGFIQKPFNSVNLILALRQALGQ